MTKNPIINAFLAFLYVIAVASLMFYGTNHVKVQTILIPIFVISLFTLSAAVMAYIFMLKPLELFLGNKRKQAVDLFVQTVGVFAAITGIVLAVVFSGLLR